MTAHAEYPAILQRMLSNFLTLKLPAWKLLLPWGLLGAMSLTTLWLTSLQLREPLRYYSSRSRIVRTLPHSIFAQQSGYRLPPQTVAGLTNFTSDVRQLSSCRHPLFVARGPLTRQ